MIIFLDGALESFAAFDSREENSEGGKDASAADREERQRVETRKRGNTLERCEPYLQETQNQDRCCCDEYGKDDACAVEETCCQESCAFHSLRKLRADLIPGFAQFLLCCIGCLASGIGCLFSAIQQRGSLRLFIDDSFGLPSSLEISSSVSPSFLPSSK